MNYDFILGWTLYRLACVWISLPSSSAHRRWSTSIIPVSDISAIQQHSEGLAVWLRPFILPFGVFPHCENNLDSSAHSPRVVSECWFGRSVVCRLTRLDGYFFIWVSVFTRPFICIKAFLSLRERKSFLGKTSLSLQDFRVFHHWRQKHDANPLCSVCGSSAVTLP